MAGRETRRRQRPRLITIVDRTGLVGRRIVWSEWSGEIRPNHPPVKEFHLENRSNLFSISFSANRQRRRALLYNWRSAKYGSLERGQLEEVYLVAKWGGRNSPSAGGVVAGECGRGCDWVGFCNTFSIISIKYYAQTLPHRYYFCHEWCPIHKCQPRFLPNPKRVANYFIRSLSTRHDDDCCRPRRKYSPGTCSGVAQS